MLGPKAIRRLIRFGALCAAVVASNRTDAGEDEGDLLDRAQRFEDFIRDERVVITHVAEEGVS